MLKNISMAAFSDEAGSSLNDQISALHQTNINMMEIRGINGSPFVNMSLSEAKELKHTLDDNGISVWSVGSPIGKINVEEPFENHLDLFKHVLELSHIVDAKNIRLFSFYTSDSFSDEENEHISFERMNKLVETAKDSGIRLCHENEKGIYGCTANHVKKLLDTFTSLFGIFDSANYIQCGQNITDAWNLLKNRTFYIHVKDADQSGAIVPAGYGIGEYKTIINEFSSMGGGTVTLEPHLKVFDGLSGLEQKGNISDVGKMNFKDSLSAFIYAADALKKLIY